MSIFDDDMEKAYAEEQYNDYIRLHLTNLKNGYDWMCMYLPEVINKSEKSIYDLILKHDASKFSEEEFMPYANRFFGPKTEENKKAFDYAWLHHIHNNPHHPEYWIIADDKGEKILDMPYEYIVEMILDWWTFGWKANKLNEIFDWYKKNPKKLSFNTRKIVEDILDKMKNKLEEI